MVGKQIPPKKTPNQDSPPKSAETYTVAPSPIVQGAASAAADAALQAKKRDDVQRPLETVKRRDKGLPGRLVSLDAFRGFIMTMLAASGFGIAKFAEIDDTSEVWTIHNHEFWNKLAFHFDHPAWRSAFDYYKVSFWDLIQPSFMFMVGVAMPFSYAKRSQQNHSFLGRPCMRLIRAVALVLIGVFLQSGGRQHTTWEFPNVLCQIGLGYFIAWCLLNFKPMVQAVALVAVLVGYWGLFFFNPPPADYDYVGVSAIAEDGQVFEGRFAAWSKNANAAFFFDRWLLPKLRTVPETDSGQEPTTSVPPVSGSWIRRVFLRNDVPWTPNRGGYTTLNFVPSIGTTLLGMLCGQLLLAASVSHWKKLGILIAAAGVCLGLGILADMTVCPIVKRIWTPSWVLFSGGYVIGMLALFYLIFDIAPFRWLAFPLVVVGMNSILIYLMGSTIAGWTRDNLLTVHFAGLIEAVFGPRALDPNWYAPITLATGTYVIFWLFLYWLHRQKIYLRL